MTPKGSYISTLGLQLVMLFGKVKRLTKVLSLGKYVTGGGLQAFSLAALPVLALFPVCV